MFFETREANSEEMKKNIKIVKSMTGKMGFDENMGNVNWKLVRLISNFGYSFMPKEKGVKVKKEKVSNIKIEISTPNDLKNEDIIFYIHGGGFVSGSAKASRGYCSMLAKYSNSRVVAINYSLAPENKYPKAVNECFEIYKYLINKYPNSNISLVGDSAGANLSLVIALKSLKETTRKPNCLVLNSIVSDFSGVLDRSIHKVNDFTVKDGFLDPLRKIYIGNEDYKNSEISPILGINSELPPMFITCDYNETLYADSYNLYKKANELGIEVEFIEMKNTFHAFATTGIATPETKKILEESCDFIRKYSQK